MSAVLDWEDEVAGALLRGASDGHALIQVETLTAVSHERGWRTPSWADGGNGGQGDLLARAARAMKNSDLTRHERAIHAVAHHDAGGRPLDGSGLYRLRFDQEAPPVENFWCIAVHRHDSDGAGACHAICAFDRSMLHASAPFELCVSNERPPTIEGRRWLPAPAGAFSLAMSFYQPLRALRDGSWRLPAIERVRTPKRAAIVGDRKPGNANLGGAGIGDL